MHTVLRKVTLLLALTLILAMVWLRPIDDAAQQYVDVGLKRALVTFASARALNALISLTQGASVSFQVGAGASVHPGAVLDPLDDLVEQFSAIMLVATLSFASQHLLILLFGAWPVSVVLTLFIVVSGSILLSGRTPPSWLSRATVGLLILSLAVPIASLASETIYQLLLAEEYNLSQAQIKTVEPVDSTPEVNEGYLDRIKIIWAQRTDVGKQIDALTAKASGLVEHIVNLAALFIVQTILLPLLFLWALLQLYRVLSGWQLTPHGLPAPPRSLRLR